MTQYHRIGLRPLLAGASLLTGLIGAQASTPFAISAPSEPALSKKDMRSFEVIDNKKLSEDTHKIRVKLPPSTKLGMTVASCLTIEADINGQTVRRPYTPISTKDQEDFAEFVIKAYPPRTDGKAGGMGAHLCSLKEGDAIKMKGPWPKAAYEPNKFKHIGMIAGGTGLTPMLQVILEILNNPDDNTKVTLIYANKSEGDILLKDMLDGLAAKHSNFTVVYTLDKAPWLWKGKTGFVSADMIKEAGLSTAKDADSCVYVCGPPPMMNFISGGKGPKGSQGEVGGVLKDLGFVSENVYKF
ncbi:hypothetical protein TrLO_g12777 [Triparma laevis f. longispina]|uniref:NADH-cytochrome b5 reductase n=1 Tax=Triparma laevis f. longispina TaxID=1714387 RepID=A0A9W7ACT9_9STRA|nr:hypothetical protein TrLO_g12777 [Triparma laevis f. longispina]